MKLLINQRRLNMDKTISIVKQLGCKVMIVTEGHGLEDVLMCIEQAIRGAGYMPEGHLDFIVEED
jgi:hypothetical protein